MAERSKDVSFAYVAVPILINKEDYSTFPHERQVRSIVRELENDEGLKYDVRFQSGHTETLKFEKLISLEDGQSALSRFEAGEISEDVADPSEGNHDSEGSDVSADQAENETRFRSTTVEEASKYRNLRQRNAPKSNVRLSGSSESEDELGATGISKDRGDRSSTRANRRLNRTRSHSSISTESSQARPGRKLRTRSSLGRSQHVANEQELIHLVDEDDTSSSSEDINLLQSDVLPRSRKRKRARGKRRSLHHEEVNGVKFSKPRKEPTRQSGRSTRHQRNMKEADMDDGYLDPEESPARATQPKVVAVREAFKTLGSSDPFHQRHCQQCDTCGKWGGGPYGQLVHCQGCILSYHRSCLGPRQSRAHLVSKVGEDDFVLQCRRCINFTRRKDPSAPDQSLCQVCQEAGPSCTPFRHPKTTVQEERDREENGGIDPIIKVPPSLVNNPANVLFRCLYCWRAFHFHHLRPRSDAPVVDNDEESISLQNFREYARDWKCIECTEQSAKVSGLVAWRPIDLDSYIAGTRVQDMNEDQKEYLVKWEHKSYFQCVWMTGAWTWGITSAAMRQAFAKRNNFNNLPTPSTEDAIPEDFLRVDIVLDVRYTSIVSTHAEEVDKARIVDVKTALTKFKGLGYEEAVWENVPDQADSERWADFKLAYDNWVTGKYVHCPKAHPLKTRLEKVRSTDFNTLEKKQQPEKLIGGELMPYQLDGVNWLYYRWYKMQNAILADEMGLGKTIQIIGFLATLIQEHNCFPFLLVVPNSTCPNWRREIMRWAPSLRVVTYFGSSTARSLSYQYELFPEGSKELRCHIVVTSYDAAGDETCQKFFRSVPWQGLIVDEGQRLKSDKSILYSTLTALKISFKILLTGTPLQNNARELFNLLQFLDDSFNAADLELEYTELTKEKIPQLHNLIRPFFLRRTKAQVLTTILPPLAQIILPVSMSTVQTKLYQSILSRNSELIRAIFDPSRAVGKGERTNLNNILMQLRKCLCHPFVYSKDIEDRTVEATVSHRNLVEASAKLQLLELLLPKLYERGHRVLIFSQFLEMLDIVEDFLDGLALGHRRLDGTISSLQKQKRIDEFNAPNSPLFAFLLSTRAGGVGINLATADTVIILDPDFNPHQDIQALSRAHRIGQTKKVLVYQLMTRASAEERIVQVGRKKMALDHVLIEQMDKEDDGGLDMESILRYGAADILEGRTQEIRYDEASIEKLLDRSQIEETKAGEDNSAESQFSFARVWANDAASLNDSLDSEDDVEKAPDSSTWERILSERAKIAEEEARARQQVLGRGRRARQNVNYRTDRHHGHDPHNENNPDKSDSDTDFQDDKSEADDDHGGTTGDPPVDDISEAEVQEIGSQAPNNRNASYPPLSQAAKVAPQPSSQQLDASPRQQARVDAFRRAAIIWPANAGRPPTATQSNADRVDGEGDLTKLCYVCKTWHPVGYCPLKIAGPEYCNLCGLAHYGVARSCPHIRSETQVGEMLQALRQSPESKEFRDLARKYLTGVKGTLVQEKKRKAEKVEKIAAEMNGDRGAYEKSREYAPQTVESSSSGHGGGGFLSRAVFHGSTHATNYRTASVSTQPAAPVTPAPATILHYQPAAQQAAGQQGATWYRQQQ